jgi:hypothetical protein
VKLTIWGVVLGGLPFVVFVGTTSHTVENGAVTQYSYVNLAAIVLGIAATCVGIALVRRGPSATSEYRRPGWAIPVCVALVLLGVFQVVRGVGVLPGITGCATESGSAGFCTDLPEPGSSLP